VRPTAALLAAGPFAAGPFASGGLAGPESGKAGPLALLVILLLGLATYLLIRSMNRHLRKVPPSFGPPGVDPPTGPGELGSLDSLGELGGPGDSDRPDERS
jgi:hypothetical protein